VGQFSVGINNPEYQQAVIAELKTSGAWNDECRTVMAELHRIGHRDSTKKVSVQKAPQPQKDLGPDR